MIHTNENTRFECFRNTKNSLSDLSISSDNKKSPLRNAKSTPADQQDRHKLFLQIFKRLAFRNYT